jgi:hypothetical protein
MNFKAKLHFSYFLVEEKEKVTRFRFRENKIYYYQGFKLLLLFLPLYFSLLNNT